MKDSIYKIIFFFWMGLSFCQPKNFYADVEMVIKKIPVTETYTIKNISKYIQNNIPEEELQIKAAYYWVISHVSYDIKHEFTTNLHISSEEYILKTLNTKKGVCMHYTQTFNALVEQLGFETLYISGITKNKNEISNLSHAWSAIKFKNGNWYLFDPTWDSGYVNEDLFVRRISSKYFKIAANKMIENHFPFDYLHQFLNKPINENAFIKGNFETSFLENVNFDLELENEKKLVEQEKLVAFKKRMEATGISNLLMKERYTFLKKAIDNETTNKNIDKLKEIYNEFNDAVEIYNEFITYRNNQFQPSKPDDEIIEMIVKPRKIFEICLDKSYALGFVGQDNLYEFSKFKRNLLEVIEEAKKHEAFSQLYKNTKGKKDRKALFLIRNK